MCSQASKQQKAQYVLNRVDMLLAFKEHREIIEKIAMDGVKTDEENKIAKIACTIIASEYCYDDSVMNDKTGEDGDFPVLPHFP